MAKGATVETVSAPMKARNHLVILSRSSEQAESGLRFLGLIIFENKLKPGTTPAIQALRQAHMPCRMITGDNPLTAVSVARECGLVTQESHVFAPSFEEGNSTIPESRLKWCSMDDPHWKLDDYSLRPLTPPLHHTAATDDIMHQDYSIVVTGDVFRWMLSHAPLETVQRVCTLLITCLILWPDVVRRCSLRRKFSRVCRQMKRTKSWSGCSPLASRFSCVATVQTIVRP